MLIWLTASLQSLKLIEPPMARAWIEYVVPGIKPVGAVAQIAKRARSARSTLETTVKDEVERDLRARFPPDIEAK